MKRLFKSIALVGILSMTVVSCKKKVTTEPNTTVEGQLKAFTMTVTSDNGSTVYQPTNLIKQHNTGFISISGAEGLGGIVSLNVADSLTPGTYSINTTGPAIIGFSNDAGQTYYNSDMGTITVVTHDMGNDKISGTFSGRIVRANPADTLTVTNGQFNVTY